MLASIVKYSLQLLPTASGRYMILIPRCLKNQSAWEQGYILLLEEMARAEEEGYVHYQLLLSVDYILKKVNQYEWIICQMRMLVR